MSSMTTLYWAAFLVAAAVSFTATPFSIWLARRYGAMDEPSARKVHAVPVPRWGGLAIYLGVIAGLAGLFIGFPRFRMLLGFRQVFYEKGRLLDVLSLDTQLAGILTGLTVVLILGMVDDRRGVAAFPKLLTQIIAALIACNYGVQIAGLRLPFADAYHGFPLGLSLGITVFWLIGFMNTINLADGLDGLAVGIAAIASATFMAVAVLQGGTESVFVSKQLKLAAILAAALCGGCIGFLPYNFTPARVFMGDGGALGIGFLLGAITVIGTLKTTALLALFIPVIVVALPVLDVSLAIARRYRRRSRIMEPDREHLHHRLLNKGWTPREVVLLVYVLTLLLSITAIFLSMPKTG